MIEQVLVYQIDEYDCPISNTTGLRGQRIASEARAKRCAWESDTYKEASPSAILGLSKKPALVNGGAAEETAATS
jgi:hypothetical protein